MVLSRDVLRNADLKSLTLPRPQTFSLPEKVLQFGTGVLLRGLPDYFIDLANQKGLFNGRVVIVKSTETGDTTDFDAQDNLYTICTRGIENGQDIHENKISSAISRVLTARKDWDSILQFAGSPDFKVVISNTTEVGITFVEESIHQNPPVSFPAKLLAVLYARYKAFNGDRNAGIIVIATELIPNNGKKLEAIVHELAYFNKLESPFIKWLQKQVVFCNSLVDRIIPGKPDPETLNSIQADLGYTDNLLIITEPYRLWAIEGDHEVSRVLSFADADKGVIIKPDIDIYRELKVRLLNGTHTITSGIACLAGIDTVRDAMEDDALKTFINGLMIEEISHAIPYKVTLLEAIQFSNVVIDRFRNHHIEHLWKNITVQYSMKLKIRVLPVLFNYYRLYHQIPHHIAFGFSAYLLYMKPYQKIEDKYYGSHNGQSYLINDDSAAYFYEKFQSENDSDYVNAVLRDQDFWENDLNAINEFTKIVKENYFEIQKSGVKSALINLRDKKAFIQTNE